MRTTKPETIVFLAGRTRAWSRSGDTNETLGVTEGRAQLMRLHDRLKGQIDALGARLAPSMGDSETLDEIVED